MQNKGHYENFVVYILVKYVDEEIAVGRELKEMKHIVVENCFSCMKTSHE